MFLPLPTAPAISEDGVCRVQLDFEQIYRAHFRRTWRLLKRVGVTEALLDDAAQDVFVVVHRRLNQLESLEQVQSWIYGIALRVASDYRRRGARTQKRRAELPSEVQDGDPVRTMEMRQSLRILYEILSELDESKRTVFVLAELERMTAPEIAELLQLNLNTTYARMRAARLRFEKCLTRRMGHSRKGFLR